MGVTNEDGYLRFIFRDLMYGDIDTCYVVPGCEGPWLDITQNPEDYIGSNLEYSLREVEAYLLVYGRDDRIIEITSISIPE